MSHSQVQALLNRAETKLEDCQAALTGGREVSLQDFEDTIGELCGALKKMPLEEARDYESPMRELSGALQALAEALTRRRDEIKQQINGLSVQQQAQNAYRKNPGYKNEDAKG